MSAEPHRVERYALGYAVYRGPVRVTGTVTSKLIAEDQRDRLDRQARRRDRKCLCCGKMFPSDGPGNRMCFPCKHRTSDVFDGAV